MIFQLYEFRGNTLEEKLFQEFHPSKPLDEVIIFLSQCSIGTLAHIRIEECDGVSDRIAKIIEKIVLEQQICRCLGQGLKVFVCDLDEKMTTVFCPPIRLFRGYGSFAVVIEQSVNKVMKHFFDEDGNLHRPFRLKSVDQTKVCFELGWSLCEEWC